MQEAQDVGEEMFGTNDLKQLAEEMIEIMRKAPGVGLAAPQIGRSLKVRSCRHNQEHPVVLQRRHSA